MSIEDYKFKWMPNVYIDTDGDLGFEINSTNYWIDKSDAIALAKHFKVNAHDIQCSEYTELQKYCQQLEDELIDIQTNVKNTSTRLS